MDTSIEKHKTIKKDIKNLSKEEVEKLWLSWIRDEVNGILDIYLPVTEVSHTNIEYSPVVKEVLESGPEFDNSLAGSVKVSLIFEFKEPIDITKPRIIE